MALISTLTDNFNDNSIDSTKWLNSNASQIKEQNSELELITTLASGQYYLYGKDTVPYDLTGSQATIKIVDIGDNALSGYQFWPLMIGATDWSHGMGWIIQGTDIFAEVDDSQVSVSATYVAATFIYLRIREAGGTTYWDYSSDGINWNNHFSHANYFTLTSIFAEFKIGTWSANASTTTGKLDDFNILPSAMNVRYMES
jgi:hypothetical protein